MMMSENGHARAEFSRKITPMKRHDMYYEAMLARDSRFDGKFFVGVKTTDIYCRPICPAKPKRENVEFFTHHLDAEKAGYRPCMRCRPESAPQSAVWMGKSAMVMRAVKMLNNLETISFHEDQFADLFGVSARHLRRVFVEEIGKTPKQLAFENRLNLARKLIVETSLPLTQVAFASGFESIRRFNGAFKERFKKAPSQLRRNKSLEKKNALIVTLSYRPPFDFKSLLHFYRNHQVGELEQFEESKMIRIIHYGGEVGSIIMSDDPKKSQVKVEIDFPNTTYIHTILSKVRSLLDLDSDPLIIANALESDPKIKKLSQKYPGVRLPSGWDPFEVAVSTILGQLVSVEQGRRLVADLVSIAGATHGPYKLFPTPEVLASTNLDSLKTTFKRKETLRAFAQAIVDKKISLEPTQDLESFHKSVRAIKGIGPWTADYMALKVIRHTDAFPSTDLILARALKKHPLETLKDMAPWRGYVAILMWLEYHQKEIL